VSPRLNLLPRLSIRQRRGNFTDEQGGCWPSVTRILNATKPQADRAAPARWQAHLGRSEAERISQTASRRGTQTHTQLRHYLLGQDSACPEIQPYWASLQPVLADVEDVRLVEGGVVHPDLGYAGQVDCMANYQGTLCVCDWKTADRPKGSVDRLFDGPLQLAAYCGAINQTYGQQGIHLKHALIVVAIAHQPAEVFWFEPPTLVTYWQQWLDRLSAFRQLPEPCRGLSR